MDGLHPASTSKSASIIRVTGDLDLDTAAPLRRRLQQAGASVRGDVIVDLSAVTFLDCAGVRPLLEAQISLEDRLRLRAASLPVLRLLQLTGLAGLFSTPTPSRMEVRRSTPSRTPVRTRG